LKCDGQYIQSEIIYWKIVPGDNTYESPITPHHNDHHDKYITYEYDEGGWNNIRMGMECLIVLAHATGRTLVIPPKQHLYLLSKEHVDGSGAPKDEMGFEDFFDIDLLRSHNGYHVLSTKEFLQLEGVTGGLRNILPPHNSSDIWGSELNQYLRKVADVMPEWSGRFIAMPNATMDITNFNAEHFQLLSEEVKARLKRFGGERSPVFYDKQMSDAHHVHFQGGGSHRLLQHHYGTYAVGWYGVVW
jgi:hypothetical protein